ncbi:hypothetical protein [Croceicoccus gelatinilyticus]|uniref:hypothetical protein n=1 Tax=Croceicoccus gelatinilyticus TaxID=2835536 RepID=UPI001BCAC845|nr:hypothetical protein [Croceicoccus gelatinilyticus]MBS7670579.1 hypothetical protein [Croceicoccus gelatinilyticus]
MFIRSENLFVRPAWPEDRVRLSGLDVPARHDPLKTEGEGLVVTFPGGQGPEGQDLAGARLIGTAGFRVIRRKWEPVLWLAPAWRHVGLFDEAEESLARLAEQLPPPHPDGGIEEMAAIAA